MIDAFYEPPTALKYAADVQARLARIAEMRGDPEMAHVEEDHLHRDVLAAIANGVADDPAAMARFALLTRDLDFARWYA